MNISLPSSSEIQGVVSQVGKTAGFPLGFIYGSTAQIPVALSVADFELRIVTAIAEVSGVQVTLGGQRSTAVQTFKLTGFLNKGFWGYIALWAYDSLGLPYSKLLKDALGNFFIGYSVGGFFDPASIPQPGASFAIGSPSPSPSSMYSSSRSFSGPTNVTVLPQMASTGEVF